MSNEMLDQGGEQSDGGSGSIAMEDTEMVELEPERVARNLALHMAAADGDLSECNALLNPDDEEEQGADAWWEDESHMGWAALHFAAQGGHTDVVKLLLRCGAIWNAVDALGNTAADVCWSLNDQETYTVLFEEGVRQTLILNLLDRQSHAENLSRSTAKTVIENGANGETRLNLKQTESANEVSGQNDRFLTSKLEFTRDAEGKLRCVDRDGGLVMAAWETDVMERTAELLCIDDATGKPKEALRILNVGFGLGIVDECFQRFKPARHVIVEAHPDAVAFAKKNGWHDRAGVEIIASRWEDALDSLGGQQFDVVYWDTYAQGYGEMRDFFEEVPYLLSGPEARFSFFHGLAGTNRFLYDVYTRVSELDLREMGLDTVWFDVRPSTTSETWNGILRKYWDLDVLRIPVSRPIAADE